jgi:hypothetical protein
MSAHHIHRIAEAAGVPPFSIGGQIGYCVERSFFVRTVPDGDSSTQACSGRSVYQGAAEAVG